MAYLFLAILCSSSIALIFKYSESRSLNRLAVTSANYFTAFAISFVMAIEDKLFLHIPNIMSSSLLGAILETIIKNRGTLTPPESFLWSVIAGLPAGLFFFLSFIYYQKSVRENGVGLAGTFGKLGILVPMIMSIWLWSEFPGGLQWAGIILSLTSIIIVNLSFDKNTLKHIKPSLILLFLLGGIAEFSNKIFQQYAVIEYKSLFLFFVFFTAFIISAVFTIRKGAGVSRRDIIVGVLVGIPNLFSSFFLIMALNFIKTSVAFPLYSAGTIVIISLSGVVLFKEKLARKDITAIVMTVIAMVLINL